MERKLAIGIVNTNNKDLLEMNLTAVHKHKPTCDFEVVVFDNTSTDGSVEMMKEKFPDVKVIIGKDIGLGKVGFGKGCNIIAEHSQSEYLYLLNEDIEVQKDCFDTLIGFLDKHPEAGCVSPKFLFPNGTIHKYARPFPPNLIRYFKNIITREHKKEYNYNEMMEITFIGAALYRRKAYEEVEGNGEDFFVGAEDIDLGYKLIKKGWKLYYCPLVNIIHHKGQGFKRNKDIDRAIKFTISNFYGVLLFYKHHYKKYDVYFFRLKSFIRASINSLLSSHNKDSKKYNLNRSIAKFMLNEKYGEKIISELKNNNP
tara:strand:+ start:2012 stop:2950 length:939 start_codon:yes stop_codon:yes gene_type:complete